MQKMLTKKLFYLLLFEGTCSFTSFFDDKSHKEVRGLQNKGHQGYFLRGTIFA
jgi:hypothetical protein